ncbi:MAG TPA: Ig-like domain repeat protein [Terriglobales bacterium]|nr:Ig-like domain repeat protein [Terriglobales bacterium]
MYFFPRLNLNDQFFGDFPGFWSEEVLMRVSASVRALCAFVRLGLLALAFVGLAFVPAAAQTCGTNCFVMFAGDTSDNICFTTSSSSCSSNSRTISFGQTIDFFEPVGVSTFDEHTATSGTCPANICGADSKFRAGEAAGHTMTIGKDYYVTFNGGSLGVGSYPFFCEPHGVSMTGTIVVNPDSTTVTLSRTAGPNPSVAGQSVTFTATVANNIIAITPTGGVTFEDFGVPISGNLPLSSGSVNFITSSLSAGTHSITAVYTSDVSSFSASTSNTVSQDVQDFSINISNPTGSALPGQNYVYNGTLTAIGGYSTAVNITCVNGGTISCPNGSTTPPGSCALLSPSNPVTMGSAFTVQASNATPASTFTFNIQAVSNSGFTLTRCFPVSLNVGNFSFSAPNPTSVNVPQGNPSSPIALQIVSQGSFSGEVDLSCVSPPAGVTCVFSNGSATHALSVGAGATVNDTLVLNTTSSVTVGAHPITVQATPAASPSQFQQQTVTLNETSATRANTYLYFGNSPDGGTQNLVPPPFLLDVGTGFSFDLSAYNAETCLGCNSQNVNITLILAEPVAKASALVSRGTGGESCTLVSPVEISCALGTITSANPFIKTVTYTILPLASRTVDFTTILSESNSNQAGPTVLTGSVKLRYRPLVRPGLNKLTNPNPR